MWKWNEGLYLSFFIAGGLGSALRVLMTGQEWARKAWTAIILGGLLGVILGAVLPKFLKPVVGDVPVILQCVVIAVVSALGGDLLEKFVTKKLRARFGNGNGINGGNHAPRPTPPPPPPVEKTP